MVIRPWKGLAGELPRMQVRLCPAVSSKGNPLGDGSLISGPGILVSLLWLGFCFSSTQAQTTLNATAEKIIQYDSDDGRIDAVAVLERKLAQKQISLSFDKRFGFLKDLLAELQVPVDSQTLVFSKTSTHRELVNPKTPRAVYFGDGVSLAWVPEGEVIDIIAQDPRRGSLFYTIAQREDLPPRFIRGTDCMTCHLESRTMNVPGWLVRSTYTATNGAPLAKVFDFVNGHNSALKERWGGWYVTGTAAGDLHLGNSFSLDPNHPERVESRPSLTRLDERMEVSRYLSPHSDIVALLVLEHQVRMLNLINHANYEARYSKDWPVDQSGDNPEWRRKRVELAGEMLLEYMLFRNEAPLNGKATGSSGFGREFVQVGPKDSRGRSLRQFDLERRIFRFPCSFLIYSPAFEGLPQVMKDYLWPRLAQILRGEDQSPTYVEMSLVDRRAVLEILKDTKPEFAAWLEAHPK